VRAARRRARSAGPGRGVSPAGERVDLLAMPLFSAADVPGADVVAEVWRGLHPAPNLPLDEPFTAGLGPLLDGFGTALGGRLDGPRSRRVIRIVGDRWSVTVGPDGVTSRGWFRRHHVAWDEATVVRLEPVEAVATQRLVATLLLRRVPVPGLHWLAAQVVDRLAEVLVHGAARMVGDTPHVLVGVGSDDGEDVALEGPLALASLLSRGLTVATVAEAERRGVAVERG